MFLFQNIRAQTTTCFLFVNIQHLHLEYVFSIVFSIFKIKRFYTKYFHIYQSFFNDQIRFFIKNYLYEGTQAHLKHSYLSRL